MKLNIIEKEVLNPLGEPKKNKIKLNPIKSPIKTICYVDNTKPNADVILNHINHLFGNIDSINISKPAGAPAGDDDIQKAVKADLTILALGDCGSCTTWVILDAIKLERAGNSTISICSHKFSDFARNLAESYGASGLRILEIEHPIAGLDEEEIELKVQNVLQKLNKLIKIT
ncbi:MAG: UGSC family (seleno)protein [Methanomicrobiales archaeon]